MNLRNKVIIVTGASDGIGKQIALKLAREQTKLALIARNKAKLEEVKQQCKELGAISVEIYPSDVKIVSELKETVSKIASDFSEIDVLVNVAGIWQKMMPLENMSEEVINEVINTNLTGLIHITRFCLPYLKKQVNAAIINVSSRSGYTAQEGQSVYSASKWGVRGFTEVLKNDLKKTGVRVAGVYQGGTNTQMFAKTGENIPQEKMHKFIDPSDLADTIVFMLSRPDNIWLHEVRVES